MSYKVKRKGAVPNVLKNTVFATYAEARKAVRQWLYNLFAKHPERRQARDKSNRTATIGSYGFSITRITN
jgi:hypothetical protein